MKKSFAALAAAVLVCGMAASASAGPPQSFGGQELQSTIVINNFGTNTGNEIRQVSSHGGSGGIYALGGIIPLHTDASTVDYSLRMIGVASPRLGRTGSSYMHYTGAGKTNAIKLSLTHAIYHGDPAGILRGT